MQADKLHAAAFVAWAKSDCSFNRSMITKDTWYSYVMWQQNMCIYKRPWQSHCFLITPLSSAHRAYTAILFPIFAFEVSSNVTRELLAASTVSCWQLRLDFHSSAMHVVRITNQHVRICYLGPSKYFRRERSTFFRVLGRRLMVIFAVSQFKSSQVRN